MFKKYTILLIPRSGSKKVRQFKLRRCTPLLLGLMFVAWMSYFSWTVRDYYVTKGEISRLARLEAERERSKGEFLRLAERIEDIRDRIVDLREFNRKVKVAVNLRPGDQSPRHMGVGGSDPDLLLCSLPTREPNRKLVRSLYSSLDNLHNEIGIGRRDKTRIHNFLEHRDTLLTSLCSTLPTDGWLSSGFGYRISPFNGRKEFHEGVDVATRLGEPVYVPAEGKVTSAGWKYGYGRLIVIEHGCGLLTKYGHLKKMLVHAGDEVKKGQKIGLVGNTGRSTGPHVHYEVHLNGAPIDPLEKPESWDYARLR